MLNHEPLDLDLYIEGVQLLRQNKSIVPEEQKESTIVEEPIVFHCRAIQVAVINASIFGGKWNIELPNASINDHLLDIVIVEAIEHLFNSRTASSTSGKARHTQQSLLKATDLTGIPGLHHIQAQSVSIFTSNDPKNITLDGELRGQTPINVQMADTPLDIFVPNERA